MRIMLAAILAVWVVAVGAWADEPALDAGLAMKNALHPSANLLTGGQPTEDDLAMLKARGVVGVVNLRAVGEATNTGNPDQDKLLNFDEAGVAAHLGMGYASIPISSADDLTEANAKLLADALAGFDGPVLVHCASGNRAGALLALKAHFVDGLAPEEALAAGHAAGLTRLEPKVKDVLGLQP